MQVVVSAMQRPPAGEPEVDRRRCNHRSLNDRDTFIGGSFLCSRASNDIAESGHFGSTHLHIHANSHRQQRYE
jgi:hypothetical protein